MSVCVALASDNTLLLDTLTPIEHCSYVLISSGEVATITGINQLLIEFFAFDTSLFSFILTAYLTAFISGHVLGRIVSGLRKAG